MAQSVGGLAQWLHSRIKSCVSEPSPHPPALALKPAKSLPSYSAQTSPWAFCKLGLSTQQ